MKTTHFDGIDPARSQARGPISMSMTKILQEDWEDTESSGPHGLKLLFTWAKEDIKIWWVCIWASSIDLILAMYLGLVLNNLGLNLSLDHERSPMILIGLLKPNKTLGRPDERPLAKVPTIRAMARRIQEEWTPSEHERPKMKFTWAKEDVKT